MLGLASPKDARIVTRKTETSKTVNAEGVAYRRTGFKSGRQVGTALLSRKPHQGGWLTCGVGAFPGNLSQGCCTPESSPVSLYYSGANLDEATVGSILARDVESLKYAILASAGMVLLARILKNRFMFSSLTKRAWNRLNLTIWPI